MSRPEADSIFFASSTFVPEVQLKNELLSTISPLVESVLRKLNCTAKTYILKCSLWQMNKWHSFLLQKKFTGYSQFSQLMSFESYRIIQLCTK